MSELQISLLAIGALVVLAVFIYNKWQERTLARGTDDKFRSRHADVLLPNTAQPENSDSSSSKKDEFSPRSTPTPGFNEELRIEPVIHAHPVAPAGEVASAGDATIDYVMRIHFNEPVAADLIARTSELATRARVRWEGLAQDGLRWQPVQSGAAYSEMRAALQMVSRQGVIQQRDLEQFSAAIRDTSGHLGGAVSADSTSAALIRARELDIFCSDVDVQIALHLVSRDGVPFAGTKLRGLAEAAGMVLDAGNQFSCRNDDGLVLYSLANKEAPVFQAEAMRDIATRGVSLLLDVPRAPGGTETFRAMVLVAQRLSQSLDAVVTDDNGNPLGDRSYDAIATQLSALYRIMEEHGVAAGSPTALRLFS